jgi:hypothetical protein
VNELNARVRTILEAVENTPVKNEHRLDRNTEI